MNLVKVESSNIEAIGWENNELFVQYKSGLYKYTNVPETVFQELLTAPSKGIYMNSKIKNNYKYTRV